MADMAFEVQVFLVLRDGLLVGELSIAVITPGLRSPPLLLSPSHLPPCFSFSERGFLPSFASSTLEQNELLGFSFCVATTSSLN